MEERAACALLKQRFEAAGFEIAENRMFDEDGVRFEIDGFDAAHRVGYEYVTSEAGDSWDVDAGVIAALAERRKRGELHVLIVDEADAPDATTLGKLADAFLSELVTAGVIARPTAASAPEAAATPPPLRYADFVAPSLRGEAFGPTLEAEAVAPTLTAEAVAATEAETATAAATETPTAKKSPPSKARKAKPSQAKPPPTPKPKAAAKKKSARK